MLQASLRSLLQRFNCWVISLCLKNRCKLPNSFWAFRQACNFWRVLNSMNIPFFCVISVGDALRIFSYMFKLLRWSNVVWVDAKTPQFPEHKMNVLYHLEAPFLLRLGILDDYSESTWPIVPTNGQPGWVERLQESDCKQCQQKGFELLYSGLEEHWPPRQSTVELGGRCVRCKWALWEGLQQRESIHCSICIHHRNYWPCCGGSRSDGLISHPREKGSETRSLFSKLKTGCSASDRVLVWGT
jgi:hypothetical protein